jgi:hypothetical protein
MSRPVKAAVITGLCVVIAAVITVFGTIISSAMRANDSGQKTHQSQNISNQGTVQKVQQQNAAVINNYGPTQEQKSERENVLDQPIVGLRNGGFENNLDAWQPSEITYASADSVAVVGSRPNVFSIDAYGRTGQCLLVFNEQPTTPGKPFWRRQRIYGLHPNSKYYLSFYVRGSAISPRSLWFAIGDDWFAENRNYRIESKNTSFNDWTKFTSELTTGDWEEAYFWIITDDVCNLRVDDISLEPAEDKQIAL